MVKKVSNKLCVNLGEKSYNIIIGEKNLDKVGTKIKEKLPQVKKTFVISNPTVFPLYGKQVINSLKKANLDPTYGLMPDGEQYKTLEYAGKFYDQLLEHKMDRSSLIISLGGGVVGDLAGFVAATYMRGINFVQLPTTLLAQVDSSIGGKVAVNHSKGKNLIGAFYQPAFVLIDVSTLTTLKKDEFKSGMGEVSKHGMALDADYFTYIEENSELILKLDFSVLIKLIYGSCQLKGEIVEKDEKEQGIRKVLNFGHTIGHALENIYDYKKYRHGEAVAIGMVCNSKIAYERGLIDKTHVKRLIKVLKKVGLPTELPLGVKVKDILSSMKNDKKSFQNKIPLILPTNIGEVKLVYDWTESDLTVCFK